MREGQDVFVVNLGWLTAVAFWPVALSLLMAVCTVSAETVLRVAVISHSPPLSFKDQDGKLTGFNIEVARELCAVLQASCELHPMPIEGIVDAVASDAADFAAVGFIATLDRQKRVLFSKTYFRSFSMWLSRPSVQPGQTPGNVAVIAGSAQALRAKAKGWKILPVTSQEELASRLVSGEAVAAVMPMANALTLMQSKVVAPLGFRPVVIQDPQLTGALHMLVNPRKPELVNRIDEALDTIKSDGRFDRINSRFIPFRLH